MKWASIAGAIAAGALALVACDGSQSSDSDGGYAPQIFFAMPADFDNFEKWESFSFDGPLIGDGGVHTAGHRIVYINHRPPPGSKTFPVGTIIAKSFPDEITAFGPRTFAMAKRGGNYNSDGAVGWEWFNLDLSISGEPQMLWRGVGPPVGDTYSGGSGGTCNDCHGAAKDNDSVQSPALLLGSF